MNVCLCSIKSLNVVISSNLPQIAMEQCEELVNGVVKNNFGDAFIRGNNGELASEFGFLMQGSH